MSSTEYSDDPYANAPPPDLRPFNLRQPVVALEHMAYPVQSREWARLSEKYPELEHPSLWYTFIPDRKEAWNIYVELERSIEQAYGSGKRRHTMAELAEMNMVKTIIRLRLFGALGGFQRVQANSATLNTTTTVKEEKKNRSLNPFKRS